MTPAPHIGLTPGIAAAVTDLAVVYEHPTWFEPLFAALDRRGVSWTKIHAGDHVFDTAASPPPAPVILNRVGMSAFVREAEHPIFYAQSLFDHWEGQGARVVNGAALHVDTSKARQLSLISRLGHGAPATRAAHRAAGPAQGRARACAIRSWSRSTSAAPAPASSATTAPRSWPPPSPTGATPVSINGVLLVQEYVPIRGDRIVRVETLAGRFLYAVSRRERRLRPLPRRRLPARARQAVLRLRGHHAAARRHRRGRGDRRAPRGSTSAGSST